MSVFVYATYFESNRVEFSVAYASSYILIEQEMIEAAQEDERELAAEMAAAFLSEELPESIFGSSKAGSGMWASCIRVINPISGETQHKINLEQNEAAHR